MNNKFKLLVLLLVAIVVYACSTDDSGSAETSQDDFDRSAMLINWADNIIIPAYTNVVADANTLQNVTAEFTNAPTVQSLQNLRDAWLVSYLSFQDVSMFEIGKAEELNYRNRLNVYPTNTSEIESFILEGNYNLSLPSTIDAQGFPALDYMLNGLAETDSEIVAFYTTNENAENYKTYLTTLSETIKTLSTSVLNDWTTNFRDSFVANISSSATGSVDKLANDYILYYEKALRAGKVGIPAGVFSTDPLPQNVEGFYKKDISKILLQNALQASRDFFNGKAHTTNTTGPSFKSYLDFLNTIKNGEDLSSLINTQFDVSLNNVGGLDVNFVNQINTDNTKMLNTYNELQRNVILLKVDMLQALDINVDFVDTDGD